MALDYVDHVFGPMDTIRAVIKKYNHPNITEQTIDGLLTKYNLMNDCKIPYVGRSAKIPIHIGFIRKF